MYLFPLSLRITNTALRNPKWCGGTTICIQVGDILDRGANELSCIRLLSKLSKQASEEGGALVCLLGNHEAMNAVGLFQYADPRYVHSLNSQ